jgi:acid stress-induced BolA-like protein IbaG/YrbA
MATKLKLATGGPQDICDAIRDALQNSIPQCTAHVSGGGGHYSIEAIAPGFASLNRLESQRTVLRAIGHLMQGDGAPVHAVDSIKTSAR